MRKSSLDNVISFLSLFQDRKSGIVTFKGAVYILKGCLMVHWIKGKYVKNQGPDSRDEKVIYLFGQFMTDPV